MKGRHEEAVEEECCYASPCCSGDQHSPGACGSNREPEASQKHPAEEEKEQGQDNESPFGSEVKEFIVGELETCVLGDAQFLFCTVRRNGDFEVSRSCAADRVGEQEREGSFPNEEPGSVRGVAYGKDRGKAVFYGNPGGRESGQQARGEKEGHRSGAEEQKNSPSQNPSLPKRDREKEDEAPSEGKPSPAAVCENEMGDQYQN